MAVDKMKLLARYKELKAQGVNVSLSELKAQMESENMSSDNTTNVQTAEETTTVNNYNHNSQTLQTGSGFSSISNINEPQEQLPAYNNTISESGWNTTYSTNTSSVSSPESYSYSSPDNRITIPQPTYSEISQQQNVQPVTPEPYTGNVPTTTVIKTPEGTKKFALIGYPLGHSLSEYIHNAGFASTETDAEYEILETAPENLVDRIKYLKSNNYQGFNVTIPLKLPVTMFLDEIDDSAVIVNAVNTVVINPETKELKGYNTDVQGFINAIPKDFLLRGKTAGILGTGGAARAAITALAQNQLKEIKLFTRNVPNSFELVNYLRKTFPNVEFNTYQIERIRDLSDIDLLVNATPIGMQGRAADFTPVEENELKTLPPNALVYDVIYNPKKTILLKLAQKLGYKTLNGIDMLIHQAVAAQQIWTGQTPDFKDMKIAALENL